MYASKEYQLPQERVVAFMDILGFRSHIEDMKNNIHKYHLIKQVFTENNIILKPVDNPHFRLDTALFSDSIVISCPAIEGDINSEIMVLALSQYLSAKLLRDGILVRGGIAKGWCHHEENNVFGEGLIKAYDLESKIACYPRILIADDIIIKLRKYKDLNTNLIKTDIDGKYFVDTVRVCITNPPFDEDVIDIGLDGCRNNIIRAYDDSKKRAIELSKPQQSNIKEKYQWLINQFNNRLEEVEKEHGINYYKKYKIEL